MTGLNSQKDDVNSDFDLFDSIMENVEAHKREEEEFFDVKATKTTTPTTKENKDNLEMMLSPNTMEVDTHESVRLDSESATTPNLKLPDSRCSTSSGISLERFEGNTSYAYTPDLHDSFDGIEVNDSARKNEEQNEKVSATMSTDNCGSDYDKPEDKNINHDEVNADNAHAVETFPSRESSPNGLGKNDANDTNFSGTSASSQASQKDNNIEVLTESPESKANVYRDDNSSSTMSNFRIESDSESEQIEFFDEHSKNKERSDDSEKKSPIENSCIQAKQNPETSSIDERPSVDESAEKDQPEANVHKGNYPKSSDNGITKELVDHCDDETESLKMEEHGVEKTKSVDETSNETVSLASTNTSTKEVIEERCENEVDDSKHEEMANQNTQHHELDLDKPYDENNEEEVKRNDEDDKEVGEESEEKAELPEKAMYCEEEPNEEKEKLQSEGDTIDGTDELKSEFETENCNDCENKNKESNELLDDIKNNVDRETTEEPNEDIPEDDMNDKEDLATENHNNCEGNNEESKELPNDNDNNVDRETTDEPNKDIPRDDDGKEESKNTPAPAEHSNNEEGIKNEEDLNSIGEKEETTEKTPIKKKRVIFSREGDTYDEIGDRRYDVRTLEMVSDDESEYVNIKEVQQAQVELSEYTRNLDNYNNVISELEKSPTDRKLEEENAANRTISFDLGELLDGTMSVTEDEDENTMNNSSGRIKSAKKNNKKLKKKKKKTSCKQCKQTSHNTTELNENGICKSCCNSHSTNFANKNRRKMRPTKKDEKTKTNTAENEDRINKEVKAALDSRLESTENAALASWLESKNKEERTKKRQERREKRAKAKENKQKKLQEEKKQQRAKEKVEEWEAKKRKEAKEKKMNNISASLKTDKSRPIMNSYRTKSTSPATESPRSDVTFEVSEQNSFERFREEYIANSKPRTFPSVEAFVRSVINEALFDLEKEANYSLNTSQIRLARPKSHAVKLQTSKGNTTKPGSYRPAPPKSANPRRGLQRNVRKTVPIQLEATIGHGVNQGKLLRSKTYEEWLSDKKVRNDLKNREKEINQHYDMLQQKLIELEKERRHALVQIRESSSKEYYYQKHQKPSSTTNLPELTKRLEPQGSESLRSQNGEAKKY